ncbi:MAG: hypothetical protein ACJ8AG_27135 [Ktedonobacteraceae bacterium]
MLVPGNWFSIIFRAPGTIRKISWQKIGYESELSSMSFLIPPSLARKMTENLTFGTTIEATGEALS